MLLSDKKTQLLQDLFDEINKLNSHYNPVSVEIPLDRMVRLEKLKHSFSSLQKLNTDELVVFLMLNYENRKLSDVRQLILKSSGRTFPNYKIRKIESFVKRKLQRNMPYANV